MLEEIDLLGQTDSQSPQRLVRPALKFRHAIRTDVGRSRNENQDSYGCAHTRLANLFIVADGMGGARGGATASMLAVNLIARLAILPDGSITPESLTEAIRRANAAIFEASRRESHLQGMGTTVVAMSLTGETAVIAHVGDSRLYRLRDGALSQLTRDHTLVQELVDSGAISASEAENHPISHMLTRSLGPNGSVQADVNVFPQPIAPGDKYLLCCDGLYNLVGEEDVNEILSTNEPEGAADLLVDLANSRGGTDNITVQVIEIENYGSSWELYESLQEGQVKLTFSGDIDAAELSEGTRGAYEAALSDTLEEEEVEQTSSATIDESAKDSAKAAPKAATSTDAYSSLLFSETNPTAEQVQAHQARYDNAPVDATPPPVEDTLDEVVVDEAPEPSIEEFPIEEARDAEQFRKLIQFGGVVIVTAFLVVGYAFWSRRPAAQQVAVNSAPSAVVVPLEETKTEPTLSDSTPSSVATGAETEATVPDEASVAPSESLPEKTDELPPTTVASADLQKTEELASLESDKEVAGAEEQQKETKIAQVIAQASELSVPPPPSLQDPSATPPATASATQPIDWDKEKVSKEAAVEKIEKVEEAAKAAAQSASVSSTKAELADQKVDLRDRIADIDAKIRNFQINDEASAVARTEELNKDLKSVDQAASEVGKNFENAKRRYDLWAQRKEGLKSDNKDAILKLSDEVAVSSVLVKRKKEAYEIAYLRYLDAVELWNENPSDNNAASKMASLGRELRSRRAQLEETVVSAVQQSLEQAAFDASEYGLVVSDLKRRRERVTRHLGFLKGAQAATAGSPTRVQLQRDLFDERAKLKAKYDALVTELSDEEELEVRRAQILAGLSPAKP